MDREVCGVCGAWKGDDELIALRQDLAAARLNERKMIGRFVDLIQRAERAEADLAAARADAERYRWIRNVFRNNPKYVLPPSVSAVGFDDAIDAALAEGSKK